MRDSIIRKQAIINRAKQNDLVSQLMEQHYKQLYQQLVQCEEDRDIFNDTYLNLTSNYKPNRPFNIEFARQFNNLKIEYRKKDSQIKFISLFDNAISLESAQNQE